MDVVYSETFNLLFSMNQTIVPIVFLCLWHRRCRRHYQFPGCHVRPDFRPDLRPDFFVYAYNSSISLHGPTCYQSNLVQVVHHEGVRWTALQKHFGRDPLQRQVKSKVKWTWIYHMLILPRIDCCDGTQAITWWWYSVIDYGDRGAPLDI